MKPRVTVLTLGVTDLEASVRFYRDGLGFATEGIIGTEFEHGAVAFFDLQPGLRLAVWPRASIGHDAGVPVTLGGSTELTIGHNVTSKAEVDAVMATAAAAGATVVRPAHETFWGGYAGYFADPDDHLWEVVWNPQLIPDPSVDVSSPPSWSLGEFRIRPLRASDAPAWHAYLSDARVIEHTSFPDVDLAGVEAMVTRALQGYAAGTSCRWAVADADDRLVGTCGFSNWSLPHAHAELVYDLAPAHWGRGVMRAAVRQVLSWAFDTARFNRVHAFVMTSNAPSIRLLEHLGFAREGMLRQYGVARGVARDFHVYALLRA